MCGIAWHERSQIEKRTIDPDQTETDPWMCLVTQRDLPAF